MMASVQMRVALRHAIMPDGYLQWTASPDIWPVCITHGDRLSHGLTYSAVPLIQASTYPDPTTRARLLGLSCHTWTRGALQIGMVQQPV